MANQALPPLLYSSKDHATAISLCATLGGFGVHRYYVGRWFSGTLQLLSTLAVVILGGRLAWEAYRASHIVAALLFIVAVMIAVAIWPLVDFWLLNTGRFGDAAGRPLLPG